MRLILSLFLAVFLSVLRGQVILTITDPGTGNAGSADVILAQAETQCNLGNNVIVRFNSITPSSVNGIVMNLSNGNLTIQPHPTPVNPIQGFVRPGTYQVSGVCLDFVCSSPAINIVVKGIKIENWNTGIRVFGGGSFKAEDNTFILYQNALEFNQSNINTPHVITDVAIETCTFSGNVSYFYLSGPIYFSTIKRSNLSVNSPSQKTFKVLNNLFNTSNQRVPDFVQVSTDVATDNLKIEIKGNTCPAGGFFGAYIGGIDAVNNHLNNDYLFNLEFENNNKVGKLGLYSPLNYWKIQNNTYVPISNSINGPGYVPGLISINPNYPLNVLPNQLRNYKLGLINLSNAFCPNQNSINNNDTYANTVFSNGVFVAYGPANGTFPLNWGEVYGNRTPGCGLTEIADITNISGRVNLKDNVSIRRVQILSGPQGSFWYFAYPFQNSSAAILREPGFPISATLTPHSVSGSNLTASFTYTGITNADNNDLYVDFYKSNANGDLDGYIGEVYYPAGSLTGNGNITIPIPNTVSVNNSDKIAITLTGLNPSGNNVVLAKGTSQAFYTTNFTPCTSATFDAPDTVCAGQVFTVTATPICPNPNAFYTWNFPGFGGATGTTAAAYYPLVGNVVVTLIVSYPGMGAPITQTRSIYVQTCTTCYCASTAPPATISILNPQPEYCAGEPILFNYIGTACSTDDIILDMGECAPQNLGNYQTYNTYSNTFIYSYPTAGIYTITLYTLGNYCNNGVLTVTVTNCDNTQANCQAPFKPTPGDYIASVWVKEDIPTGNINSFTSGLSVTLYGPSGSTVISIFATPPGNGLNPFIDGWQKVEGRVTIPPFATSMDLSVVNNHSSADCYFDDIRFHPVNSGFKSYVYDPVTLRLVAELDDRNYATFYEYDEEGQLIRVKKETEKGIKTIKETRTSVRKN